MKWGSKIKRIQDNYIDLQRRKYARYPEENIRNCIIAHIDHGKSTLTIVY